ncbi:hypothetical protein GTW66_21375 [Streptomyces sp. SID5473]|uniref:Uncharacterized protein n=2 Tax=Streptomyces TaxID=1883 RepID=A0A7G3UPX7_STRT9|nr:MULTISPECIES: hypothetical protein [Streptomyces]AZK98670.1 hypothetical protein B7R87_26830 [Streptomyces tsukubensis]MYS66475.1 hypothetical protein [Streptomyces sp. SID5473]QKM71429.1 hypothetical protein STSU_006945 [Streptomyces tsukubensis NRRL18488]TAI41611.1 hypothetical protein EWI31_27505 [Streptomyces tsukubensis]
MTVGDLIDRLSALDPAAPVRLAVNPFFPMAHTIAGVVEARDETGEPVVFLADSGDQLGPLPPQVAVRLAWQEPTTAPARSRRRATRPAAGQ